MTPLECCRQIAALRQQIESGQVFDAMEAHKRLEEALLLLNRVAVSENFPPTAIRQVWVAKRSIQDFYLPSSSRGWAQRFAVNDLQHLEELCRPLSEESGKAW